ncbi:hypothetical protein GQ457_08G012390 [Hibiscus cannabinus]
MRLRPREIGGEKHEMSGNLREKAALGPKYVIRRAPHEFKIACLEDIKKLFPSDYNPFYAGFGNRDTDELSYRKIGIPKGKISNNLTPNWQGEVAISHCIDVKSYTSLHTLVNDMFPPTSLVEQEDFNSWNFWKVPLPDIE